MSVFKSPQHGNHYICQISVYKELHQFFPFPWGERVDLLCHNNQLFLERGVRPANFEWWMWLLLKNVSPNADWKLLLQIKGGGGDTVRMHRAIWSVWSIGGGVWQGWFILGLCLQQLSPEEQSVIFTGRATGRECPSAPVGASTVWTIQNCFIANIYCREVTTCTNLTFDTICM